MPGKWTANWREQRLSIGREIDVRLDRSEGQLTRPDMTELANRLAAHPGVAAGQGRCSGSGLDAPAEQLACDNVVVPVTVLQPLPLATMLPDSVQVEPESGVVDRFVNALIGSPDVQTYRVEAIRVTGFTAQPSEAEDRQKRLPEGEPSPNLAGVGLPVLVLAGIVFAFTGAGQSLIETFTEG